MATDPIRLLSPAGELIESEQNAPWLPTIAALSDERLQEMHRHMVVIRRVELLERVERGRILRGRWRRWRRRRSLN